MVQGVALAAAFALVLTGAAVAAPAEGAQPEPRAEQTAPAGANGLPLPDWRIPKICAEESAPAICTDLEARARNAVAAGWPFLLDGMKRACLDEVRLPADRSWRLLAECIDRQALKAVDADAVRTAKTPAAALPAASEALPVAAPETGAGPSQRALRSAWLNALFTIGLHVGSLM
jgi:hypothetical protein